MPSRSFRQSPQRSRRAAAARRERSARTIGRSFRVKRSSVRRSHIHDSDIDYSPAGTTSATGQSRRCCQRLSAAGLPSTAEEPQPWPSRPESDRPQIAPERNTTSCNVLKERAAQERKSLSRHIPLDFPGTGSIAVHVDGPLLGCHPPGSARRACGGASIAMGDADPEDEDDGQQATPQANKERRKGR